MPHLAEPEPPTLTRRQLILHDSLGFLALLALTLVLLAVTLLCFRAFTGHRAALAREWSQRGEAALAAHQPQAAITSLRAALTFAPYDAATQQTLALALAEDGRTEEAFNYFLELWQPHPGDGAINLQLARLAARKAEYQQAVNFYRAALYGTWEGDAIDRRRETRLELAQYLLAEHQPAPARAELLIAAANNPGSPVLDDTIAALLLQANAPTDALALYRKALAQQPHDLTALKAIVGLAPILEPIPLQSLPPAPHARHHHGSRRQPN